ncbi:MAG: glycosyltransferase family 2 protein [bacterium]|nr:glycosyltransferase family 2 protein [bacterium]
MTPKIGIILINYKDYAKRFLTDCRDSMRLIDYPREKYVVYIVDNATTKETEAYLRQTWPEAVILPNKENAGWGGGNNVGIEQAFKDGCEDILFSNMDVIVEKDWLKELVETAYSDERPPLTCLPDRQAPPSKGGEKIVSSPYQGEVRRGQIGMVQSKLLLWPIKDGIQRINSVGNALHFLGFGYCNGYGEVDVKHNPSQPPLTLRGGEFEDIPYASGASCYVKGEVLKKIGLCNSDFFMYHDDVEICLKAKLAGFRVVLAPKSIMWHKYEFGRSILQVYYMERNRLITMLEFYKLPTLLLLAPAFFIMEVCVFFGSLVGGYAKPKLRSWGYFFKRSSWKKIGIERRKIQTLRTMSDRALMQDCTGKILFQEVMNPILKYIVNPILSMYWGVAKRIMWW